jgi:hypothetical protein
MRHVPGKEMKCCRFNHSHPWSRFADTLPGTVGFIPHGRQGNRVRAILDDERRYRPHYKSPRPRAPACRLLSSMVLRPPHRHICLPSDYATQMIPQPPSSRMAQTQEIMTRTPYRCAVGVRAETWVSWGLILSWVQTSEDRATTGVQNRPLTRLVLVRPEVMSGGVARAGRQPR